MRRLPFLCTLFVAVVVLLSGSGSARAAGCPARDQTPLPNAYLAAKSKLVPPGASSLLVCRYGGLNAGANAEKLVASASVDASATISELAHEFDALPQQKAVFHCPMDDGSAIIAIFRYAKSSSDPVRVGLKGCLLVSNEDIVRTAASPEGGKLIRQLEQLLRPATTSSAGEPVPAGFDPESFTAVSEADYWILGTIPCRTGRCSAILRTTDGGSSFARIPAPALPATATTPALRFADRLDGFAFVSGSNDIVYATHDGGATWHRLALGSLVAFTTAGGNAYAVTARCPTKGCSGYRFERSPVTANTWSASAMPFTPDGSAVDLTANGSRVWLLGTPAGQQVKAHDELARSTDGGRTFVTGPGPCYPDLGGDLAPTSSAVVWAVCPTGMMAGAWRSTDGGITFRRLTTPPLVNSAQLAPASGETAVVVGNGAGSRLVRTTDAGASWKAVRTPSGATYVPWVGFTDAKVGAALVQTRYDASAKVELDDLWRTTDGGAVWSVVRF